MDIAVNLVENYLRLTGYLTLSEWEIQRRLDDGTYKTLTDVDVMAVRFPGATFVGDPHDHAECQSMVIDDPVLELEDGMVDVVIGEVKQGPAELNPALKDHAVLHSMLRRVQWVYAEPVTAVIEGLQARGVHTAPGLGGGLVRTRLVAFGRSSVDDLTTISHSHIIRMLLAVFEEHEDAFRPVQFKEPAPAFLRLLLKTGFDVSK